MGDPEALLRAFAASDPMVEVVHGEVDRCRFCEYVTGKWDHDGACPWRIAREWVADNPD